VITAAWRDTPITAEVLEKGIWLTRAPFEFGQPHLIEKCNNLAAQFHALGGGETVATFPLCTTLTGKARDAELLRRLHGEQQSIWLRYLAGVDCLRLWVDFRLGSESSLVACGAPHHAGAPLEWIEPRAWHYLNPDSNHKNVVRGDGISWWCVKVFEWQWLAECAASAEAETEKAPGPGTTRTKPFKSEPESRRMFKAQAKASPDMTTRKWNTWAKDNNIRTTLIRHLTRDLTTPRPVGRPRNSQSRTNAHE